MSDYSDSKFNVNRSTAPENAIDAQEWNRVEPLITPTQLRSRFLKGLPLMSSLINPVTKKADVWTDDDLKDHITRAVTDLEADTNNQIDVFPVKRSERHQFDRALLNSWGHFKLEHAPITSVSKLSIASGQDVDIYTLPNNWIDNAYFNKGLIYFTPLLPASTIALGNTVANTAGAAAFLQYIMQMGWSPAMWKVEYTTGFTDGVLPRIINELIGCYAAMEVLSLLAATNRSNTHSLGMDGMSQSISTPGPEVYNVRISYLDEKRKKMLGKLKAMYGRKFVMSNI